MSLTHSFPAAAAFSYHRRAEAEPLGPTEFFQAVASEIAHRVRVASSFRLLIPFACLAHVLIDAPARSIDDAEATHHD